MTCFNMISIQRIHVSYTCHMVCCNWKHTAKGIVALSFSSVVCRSAVDRTNWPKSFPPRWIKHIVDDKLQQTCTFFGHRIQNLEVRHWMFNHWTFSVVTQRRKYRSTLSSTVRRERSTRNRKRNDAQQIQVSNGIEKRGCMCKFSSCAHFAVLFLFV